MNRQWNDAAEFFASTRNLYLWPTNYRITLATFMTSWQWRASEDDRPQSVYVRFENCSFIRTEWTGRVGPYNIKVSMLDEPPNKRIELSDERGEFRVVCESIRIHATRQEAFEYYRNVRVAESMF